MIAATAGDCAMCALSTFCFLLLLSVTYVCVYFYFVVLGLLVAVWLLLLYFWCATVFVNYLLFRAIVDDQL